VKWELLSKPYRHYTCNGSKTTPSGLKIGSVTQVLGVLDKPALVGWAANVTAEGAWTLAQNPRYKMPRHWRGLLADIKAAQLDATSVRDAAADRGTSIHKMFEDFANEGIVPNPASQPDEWRGYVRSLAAYLIECSKNRERIESAELIVGSLRYGFAGTCDTVAVTVGPDGKRVRRDFKSAKQCYARTHFRQLAAYELAAVEMGDEPCDELAIIVLHDDGTFRTCLTSEVEWAVSPEQSFLNVLQVWRDDQPLKKHEDAEYKARRDRAKAKA
jgi:hypothetical protein